MKLSVVTTLYRSKPFLAEFIEQILTSITILKITEYELIFVNDGSPDDSLGYLLEQKKTISQIRIIDLSRNFGHHYAVQAGLQFAKGDYIFLIDNDLEVSPTVLINFYNEIITDSTLDVVYGYQEDRKGGVLEKKSGAIFWKMMNTISETPIPNNIVLERLMSKQYVQALLQLNDANLFIDGMMYWVGFHQKGIAVQKSQREGESTYSFAKRLQLMVQAITSFSGKPLEWMFYSGILITTGSIVFLIYLFFQKLIYQDEVQLGWTSIIGVNILILGVISMFLGLIGVYLFKIFKQVQGRPNVIVKHIYN